MPSEKQKPMITTNIVFDRKKLARKTGKGTLEVRITIERKSYYIGTGIRVRDGEWRAGKVVNRPDAQTLNDRLAIIYEKVSGEVNRCIQDGQQIETESMRKAVWQVNEAMSDDPVFLQWAEDQTGKLNVGEGTVKHYRSLMARLTEYGEIRKWQDVTTENLTRFDLWLHQRKTVNGDFISDAAVYKYHKCLKALLHRAIRFGKMEQNPYDRVKFKRGEKENVEYLTEREMRRFEAVILPAGSQLDIAHDLFIFQMYSGLPYSDMMAFDIAEYKWDGKSWNRLGSRIKTGVPYVSSLLPPVVKVLEKYNYELPKMNNADYNKHLKALGLLAGIKTRLHSHLARHTFATFMLRNGVKIENVSKMLGHTNITQTQRYAKVLAQSVHEDFDMIASKMTAKAGRKKKSNH